MHAQNLLSSIQRYSVKVYEMALDLSAPPEGTFSTFDSLFTYLQDYAKLHGYAVAVAKSTRARDGTMRTRYIHCVKGGKPRDRVSCRKKPLISQKTECPFKCRAHLVYTVHEDQKEENWELTVMNELHNHEPNDLIAHHQYRRFPSPIQQ